MVSDCMDEYKIAGDGPQSFGLAAALMLAGTAGVIYFGADLLNSRRSATEEVGQPVYACEDVNRYLGEATLALDSVRAHGTDIYFAEADSISDIIQSLSAGGRGIDVELARIHAVSSGLESRLVENAYLQKALVGVEGAARSAYECDSTRARSKD